MLLPLQYPYLYSPLNPANLPGIQLYLEASDPTLSTAVHSSPQQEAVDGNLIFSMIQPGDVFVTTAHPYAEQGSAPNRPTLSVSNGRYRLKDGGKPMTISPSNPQLSAPFIVWTAFVYNTADYIVAGSGSFASGFGAINGHYGLIDDDTDQFTTAYSLPGPGTFLVRIRSDGTNLLVKGTGMGAEENLGPYGSITTLDTINNTITATGNFNLNNMFMSLIVSTNAGVATSPPGSIDGLGGYFDRGIGGYGGYGLHL